MKLFHFDNFWFKKSSRKLFQIRLDVTYEWSPKAQKYFSDILLTKKDFQVTKFNDWIKNYSPTYATNTKLQRVDPTRLNYDSS